MNAITKETLPEEWADEQQDALRQQVLAERDAGGKTNAAFAREIGVPTSTLGAWLNREYKGVNGNVAAEVARGMAARAAKLAAQSKMRKVPGFVETPTALSFFGYFRGAMIGPDIVSIIGHPGTGKTMAAREFQRLTPNVYLVTAEPSISTPQQMLREIGEVMGIATWPRSAISRNIINKLAASQGMLIMDEAQLLTPEALDQLRILHDKSNCGIVVMGNPMLKARVEGGNKYGHSAPMTSRFGAKVVRIKPRKDDINALLKAWEIAGDDECRLLHDIANKPGALRSMTKTLRYAGMIADQMQVDEIDVEHISKAYARLAPAERGAV